MHSRPQKSFIEQLSAKIKDPKDGAIISAQIKKNDKSRLFDSLPDHFYSIFDDYFFRDYQCLRHILRTAKAQRTGNGDQFTDKTSRGKIKAWCKSIMNRGYMELLDIEVGEKNKTHRIKPEVLTLLGKTRKEISCRDLISAYFGAINQCLLAYIPQSKEDGLLTTYQCQFSAFMQYINTRPGVELNNFSVWSQEILDARIKPKKSTNLGTTEVVIGTVSALGAFGALVTAWYLINKNSDNNNNSPQPHRREFH